MRAKKSTDQSNTEEGADQKPRPKRNLAKALYAGDEGFKSIFDESPVGIEIYDADGLLMDANPACLRMFGVSNLAQVKGFKLFEDPNLPDKEKAKLRRGKTVRYEAPFDFEKVKELRLYDTTKSGIVHLDVRITPVGVKRKAAPQGYLVQVQDITERKLTEEALRQHVEELAALQAITLDFATQQELLSLLNTIVERAMALLNAPCGFIYLHDTKTNELELVVEQGLYASPGLRLRMGEGMAGQVTQTRQPLNVDDYSTWEGRSPHYAAVPYHAVIEVPLLFGGQLIGILGVNETAATRKYNETDLRLLSLFAGQAASAVRNSQLFQGIQTELAERKRTEQTLLQTEKRYRTLFEQSPDGVLLIDPETARPIVFNTAAHSHLGYSREEFARLRITDYEIIEKPEVTEAHIQNIIQQGRDDFETKHRTKQGEIRNVNVTAQTIELAGRPVLNCIFRDITERKRAETALLEAETRYRTLVEQITAVTYIDAVDQASSAIFMSPQVDALTGYTPEEWKADPELWIRLIHPKDRARVLAENIRTNETGDPFKAEYRIIARDGRIVWVRDEAMMFKDEAGQPQCWQGVMLDITERKRAEETLRESEQTYKALIDTTRTGYLIINSQGQVVDANAEYVRLSGHETLQEILGRSVVEWTAPHDQLRNAAEVEKCAKAGIVRNLEIDYISKNGVITPIEINATVVQTEKGTMVLSLCRDITDRKRAEKAREITLRISQAAVSTESLEELYHSIHELLGELMPVENFYIALYEPSNDLLSFPYFVDQYDQPAPPQKPGRGLTEYVLRIGKPLLAPPEVFDQLLQQGEVELVGTNSVDWLGIPLEVKQQVIGVMVTQSYTEGIRFSQADADMFTFVSTQVAMAIERVRLYAAEKRRATRLIEILQLSMKLVTSYEKNAMLNHLVARAAEIMESATCTVMMIDTEANEAVLAAQIGLPESTAKELRVPLALPIIQRMLETGEPIILPNINHDAPAMRSVLVRPDIQAFFAYPMIRAGRAIGLITFSKLTPYTPSAEEVAACQLLAERAAASLENARLFEETSRSLEQVKALHTIDLTIASSFDLRLTLNILLEQTRTQLGVDAVDILVYNPHTQVLDFAASSGFRTTALQGTHLRLGQGYAGIAGLERKTVHVSSLRGRKTDFLRSPSFSAEEFDTYYGVPLIAKGQIKGVLEAYHRSPLKPDQIWTDFLETLAKQAAIAIDNATLFSDLQSSNAELTLAYDTTLAGWSKALDLRDKETEGHTQRVVETTIRLARAMRVIEAELTNVRRGALLHDIGKMGIPDEILHKPGPLSVEEWATMRQHPVHAREMLSPIAYLRPALEIPYNHHEKWDGSGYPNGLKGEQIPLAARIFTVVDVFDALTSDRPYRLAWPREKALNYIREQAGKYFDPAVVEMFLKIVDSIKQL
jgi:PAS domain S-box-containing protein